MNPLNSPSLIPSKKHLASKLIALVLLTTSLADAQMRTGEQMKGFAEAFGTSKLDVEIVTSSAPGNILHPDDSLTLGISNSTTDPVSLLVIPYGTRSIKGDIWLPEVVVLDTATQVELPAKAGEHQIAVPIPAKFGAYAIVAKSSTGERKFLTSVVRALAPLKRSVQYPTLSLDSTPGPEVLSRLGIRAVRMGYGFVPRNAAEFAEKSAQLEDRLKVFQEHGITVLMMFLNGVGKEGQPLGRPRPHLDAEGVMLDTKQDMAWLPSLDAEFRDQVTDLCEKYGWPRGPITGVSLWNEPWDGISISGWGADMLRFREIFTAMAEGTEAARKAGVEVLIAGCDSSSNTRDKLFSDGSTEFLKWLDACTIHYQGSSAPSTVRAWMNRQSPYGRVKIWDTESWVANTEDRVAAVIAANRAFGYDRAMGIYHGNVAQTSTKELSINGKSQEVRTTVAWPPAAAVAAAQRFIGERPFRELLFRNGLPWILVFDGEAGQPDDGTVVVIGDLSATFNPRGFPFRGVERSDTAQLVIANPGAEFITTDAYGNLIDQGAQQLKALLDGRGIFFRTNGKPGSFERLLEALREARIEGYEPVDIVLRDPVKTPGAQDSSLRVDLTNILNRPISGSLSVQMNDHELSSRESIHLPGNETVHLEFSLPASLRREDNNYPVSVKFDAGESGIAQHEEIMRVNAISKRTITVDGNLEDWRGALPQPVRVAGEEGPTLEAAAWLPFEKFDASEKTGAAVGFVAADERYFYFAAKILDDSQCRGTQRFETRDENADFYPETSFEYDPAKTFLGVEERWNEPTREKGALRLPDSTERSFIARVGRAKRLAFEINPPQGESRQISIYLLDWDPLPKRRVVAVEVFDIKTGKSLAKQDVADFGRGVFARFEVFGAVRFEVRSRSWMSVSMSGIFVDPGTQGVSPVSAKNLGLDWETGGQWQGHYGKLGHHIFGAPPLLPSDIAFAERNDVFRIEHKWPEGVRRYSYRRRPSLPFGSDPKFDNVQLAFNVIPMAEKPDMIPFPAGTRPGFVAYQDTDYEFALNPVAQEFGGGYEVWRSLVPGMPRKHFYPRQPKSPLDGPVNEALMKSTHEGNTRIVEAAIPWSEIPLVKAARDAGRTVKFSFRINDNNGPGLELAEQRSVSKSNSYAFHPDWIAHWANELEFAFE